MAQSGDHAAGREWDIVLGSLGKGAMMRRTGDGRSRSAVSS